MRADTMTVTMGMVTKAEAASGRGTEHLPLGAVFLKTFTAFTIEVGFGFSDEKERA